MRPLIVALTVITMFLHAAPARGTHEIVTIDPGIAPLDPNMSFAHAWAAAGTPANAAKCGPNGTGNTGNAGELVECHMSRTSGGNSAWADSSAQVTPSLELSATTGGTKANFAAAAAYAQGGGQVVKHGTNKGVYLSVKHGGLKVANRHDPMDAGYDLVVSNLGNGQLDGSLFQKSSATQALLEKIKGLKGWTVKTPEKVYFRFSVEAPAGTKPKARWKITYACGPGVKVEKADEMLCPAKEEPVPNEQLVDLCKDMGKATEKKDKEQASRHCKGEDQPAMWKLGKHLDFKIFIPGTEENDGKDEKLPVLVELIQYTETQIPIKK